MKKLLIPASFMLFILSCKNEPNKEPSHVIHGQPYYKDAIEEYTPISHYMFAAVNVEHRNGIGYKDDNTFDYTVFVSDIVKYNHRPSEDEQYLALDQISSSHDIKMLGSKRSITERKAYIFTSYTEASKERQEILKIGVK